MKYLKITLLVLLFSGDINGKKALKKKALKMTSQLAIFRAFLFIFFVPPNLDLKKNPVNQLIKKIWPKVKVQCIDFMTQRLEFTSIPVVRPEFFC